MSHESSEEQEVESTTTTTTTTEVEEDARHSNANSDNLLQVLVQRSPLSCGTCCTECCTHSMREGSSIAAVPHVKIISPTIITTSEEEDPEEGSAGGSKTYEIQVKNLSYKLVPTTAASAAASILHKLSKRRLVLSDYFPDFFTTKYVLQGVSCVARPGELLAIAGPSGAGKSTLLELLAGRIQPTKDSSILVNNQPMAPSHFRRISGYVMQHDALFPLLTVSETLMFSAQFRLPSSMSEVAKRARVESLLMELGLQDVASSRIGSDTVRGVSGGERRRVSIGMDVIHDPAVLLLDEPTSGLDSGAALQVVVMLHNMAKLHQRTIILSIHQPGVRILELIHSVVLLAKGRVVHSGNLEQLADKFVASGHRIPPEVNVVEYAIENIVNELISHDEEGGPESQTKTTKSALRSSSSSLKELFDQVKLVNHHNDDKSPVPEAPLCSEKPTFANSRLREILLLSNRCGKIILRTRQLSAARTLQAVFAGLALGTIFLRLGHDLKGVQERYGFFAFTLTFLLTSTSEALPMFLEERHVFMRETSRGAYRVSSYVVSNTLMFLPFLLVFSLLYTIPTYYLVGLNTTTGCYPFFLLIVWVSVVVANAFVAFFSALVPNYIMGNTMVTGVMGAFFLFSGYFITENRIPKYWLFMHYLSLFKYPLDAMLINEYSSVADECFGRVIGGICTLTGRDVLAQSSLQDSSKWDDLVVMVAFAFAYRFLSYIVLRYKPRHRQH